MSAAFLPHRQILDGVLVVNEVVDLAKRSKESCFIFKLDFMKAYESVCWDYLDYMMGRLGFCDQWRLWMRACIFAGQISILENGSPTKEVSVQKGLRQGDPLAPFLFLIASEGLSGLMSKAIELGKFYPFTVGDGLQISLLQYADDTLFIGQQRWENLWVLKTVLRSFELVSGLKVNFHKSSFIGVNVDDRFLYGASCFLNCVIGQVPFKFLGLPIGANPRRFVTWKPVIDMMNKRLAGWKGRHLSLGGRIVLVNSVLSALPL